MTSSGCRTTFPEPSTIPMTARPGEAHMARVYGAGLRGAGWTIRSLLTRSLTLSRNCARIQTRAALSSVCGTLVQMGATVRIYPCLLYTSDAADERSSVDLGGRRIIK